MRPSGVSVLRALSIAVVYAALSLVPPLNSIAFGPVQVRIADALIVLAFFEPAAIVGVALGAFVANYFGPYGIPDAFLGGGLTLLSAYMVWKTGRPGRALLYPVLLKGVGITILLKYLISRPVPDSPAFLLFSIGGGEAVALYLIGYPLLMYLLNSGVAVRREILAAKLGRQA